MLNEPIYNRMLCDLLSIDEDENDLMGVDDFSVNERKEGKENE